MPELPEVECVRQGIIANAIGQKIQRVQGHNLTSLLDPSSLSLSKLKGQHIRSINRKGKYLQWLLDDFQLLAHLGMSGMWGYNTARQKHTHLELKFESGNHLLYTDPRRFGYLCLLPLSQKSPRWENLGIDALDAAFNSQYLFQISRNSSVAIKVWLMDQSKIAGVGNIYASEVLFEAKIHPVRPAKELNLKDCQNLSKAIKRILKASIKNSGTTFSDYKLTNGHDGAFQNFLKVFHKTGEPCPRCQSPIIQITQATRSTFFCENCTPLSLI